MQTYLTGSRIYRIRGDPAAEDLCRSGTQSSPELQSERLDRLREGALIRERIFSRQDRDQFLREKAGKQQVRFLPPETFLSEIQEGMECRGIHFRKEIDRHTAALPGIHQFCRVSADTEDRNA